MSIETTLEKLKILINDNGFEYYSELPQDYRPATIEDFIVDGRRKLGMMFLIQWVDNAFFYQICYVSVNLTRAILNPHLESKRVFVCENS
jgi:hypothetical protein